MLYKKILFSIALAILALSSSNHAIFEQIKQSNFQGNDIPDEDDRPNRFDEPSETREYCPTCIEDHRRMLGNNYPNDPRFPNKTYLEPYLLQRKTILRDDADLRPWQNGTLDMPFLDGR